MPNGFLADGRIVRADEAESLLNLGVFLGPSSPAAAALPPPVHHEVRFLHPLDIGEDAVPKKDVVHRPARTAKLAKNCGRFAKADDEKIEVDHLAHPLDGLQHLGRIKRVQRRVRG